MNSQSRDTRKQFLVPLYLGLLAVALVIIVSLHVSRYMSYRDFQLSSITNRMKYQQSIISRFFRDIAGDTLFVSRSLGDVSEDLSLSFDLLLRSKPQYRSVTVYNPRGIPVLHFPGGLRSMGVGEPLNASLLQRLSLLGENNILLESKFISTAALWTEPVPPVLEIWSRAAEKEGGMASLVRVTVDITVLTAMMFPGGRDDPYYHYFATSEGQIISLHGSAETLPSPQILQKVMDSGSAIQSQWINNILVSSGRINLNTSGTDMRIISDIYHLISVLPASVEEHLIENRLGGYVLWFMLSALLLIPVALLINRGFLRKEEAEGKLIKSLEFQSAILRTLPDSIFRIDEDELLHPVQLHPYTNRILQTQDFPTELAEAFADDLSYKIRYYRNIVLDLERETWFEYRNEGRRGFFYEFRFVKSGETEVLLVVRNRTEEREQQRRLYTASQFLEAYRQAMDASSLVAKTDKDGNLIYMNDHFRERFSIDFNDSIGRNLADIMRPVSNGDSQFMDAAIPSSLRRLSGLIKCRNRRGGEYFIDNSLLPVQDETGEIQEIISFGHDVTELHNALEQARAAEHARASFIARMSHEMRTPLNCIIGFAEAAEEAENLAAGQHYSRMILNESGSLLDLINQVLDFSKIEAGKLKPQMELFHLGGLLDSVLQSHRESADRKDLRLYLSLTDNLPAYVSGDALRIRQVLNNLISNALKFTDEGEVCLSAETLHSDKDGGLIRFLVRDTGIGIPEKLQTRIFDSFFQADTGDNRRYGGTGLGTTIARQLVELMDGSISFESSPGSGTSFWFDLYMAYGDPQGSGVLPSAVEEYSGLPDLRGKRILIAEDYRPNAEVMQIMLKPTGAVLIFAADGASAAGLYSAEHPDLIFMDVHMPEKNGYEATEAIRIYEEESGLVSVPIVGVTANAFKRDIRRCHESGMNEVLVKPLRKTALYKVIADLLPSSVIASSDTAVETLPDLKEAENLIEERLVKGKSSAQEETDTNGKEYQNDKHDKNRKSPVFDAEALLAEVDGDSALARTLVGGFLEALNEQRLVIEEAMKAGDWVTLHREVHSIKGGSANLFADPLHITALALEKAARKGDEAAVEAAFSPFMQALKEFSVWPPLSEFLQDDRVSSDKRNS